LPDDHGNAPRDRGGPPPSRSGDQTITTSTVRGGLQLGPPGRWWDDKHFAKSLKLRPEQQRRMDGIFEQSRASLLRSYEILQGEEQRMEALTHARPLDESALDAQIDRVAQARADLEKANTHLLYQIRGEMDPDQIARLEDHR
jgi:Spy/CpxP family protein refolding chaperone